MRSSKALLILSIMERKIHFRENCLIFLGVWGKAELFWGDLGSEGKILQGSLGFLGIWGDQ